MYCKSHSSQLLRVVVCANVICVFLSYTQGFGFALLLVVDSPRVDFTQSNVLGPGIRLPYVNVSGLILSCLLIE
jgi:hypothetical protein